MFALFCPQCDSFLVDVDARRPIDACASCGWLRPAGTGKVGERLGEPIDLGMQPRRDSHAIVAGGRLWLTGVAGDAGCLVGVDLTSSRRSSGRSDDEGREGATGAWSAGAQILRVMLDPRAVAEDLATDGRLILVGPNDIDLPLGTKAFVVFGGDGREVWRYSTEAHVLSPAGYGAGIIAFSSQGTVYILEVETQRERWVVNVPVSLSNAPLVAGRIVAVNGAQNESRPLRALSVEDGAELWMAVAKEGFSRAPCAYDEGIYAIDGMVKVGELVAFAAQGRKRKELWSRPFQAPRKTQHGSFTSGPVAGQDWVLVGCRDNFPEGPGYALHAVRRQTGEPGWRVQTPSHVRVRPAMVGDIAVCADDTGSVICCSVADGKEQWTARLGRAAVSVPAFHGDAVYIADASGRLHAFCYRLAAAAPSESPQDYERKGDWAMAAAAHVLANPPNLSAAGLALMRLGDPKHARRLFEKGGDHQGIFDCFMLEKDWRGAIDVGVRVGDRKLEAKAQAGAGNYRQAAAILAELGEWAEAVSQYERAGQPDDLVAVADILAKHVDQPGRATQIYLEVAVAYEAANCPDLAWPLYLAAGEIDKARSCFESLLSRLKKGRFDAEAGRLCEDWAIREIERAGREARCNEEIARRLEEAARYYFLAEDDAAAERCRTTAAFIMETPRFQLGITAANASFVHGKASVVAVHVTNIGFGPAGEVVVRIAGDVEQPYSERKFVELQKGKSGVWKTARIKPLSHGDTIVRIEVEYKSYRFEKSGGTSFEEVISVSPAGVLETLGMGGKGAVPVQLNIQKIVAPGATDNEMTVGDVVKIDRGGPLGPGGATGGGDEREQVRPGLADLLRHGTDIKDSVVLGGRPVVGANQAGSDSAGEHQSRCPNCGATVPPGRAGCPTCG